MLLMWNINQCFNVSHIFSTPPPPHPLSLSLLLCDASQPAIVSRGREDHKAVHIWPKKQKNNFDVTGLVDTDRSETAPWTRGGLLCRGQWISCNRSSGVICYLQIPLGKKHLPRWYLIERRERERGGGWNEREREREGRVKKGNPGHKRKVKTSNQMSWKERKLTAYPPPPPWQTRA